MGIYVGNLNYDVTEEELKAVLAEYGTVQKVHLPVDRETGRKRGFGFVDMANEAEEESVISELDGAEWMGRQMKVNKARPRESRPNKIW
jgi:RNA recognition motif-containing protein